MGDQAEMSRQALISDISTLNTCSPAADNAIDGSYRSGSAYNNI